jgi:hypothetical protein
MANIITAVDAKQRLLDYEHSIQDVGRNIPALRGRSLILELKRGKTGIGPYPDVSLFESANRIMTDLVILNGVKWLLTESGLEFEAYTVEYGHENNNRFDIQASKDGRTLIGEAFNVAPSFFQGKKAAMIKKLRIDEDAEIKLVMFNHDAVARGYVPNPPNGMHFVFVDIDTGECSMTPKHDPC